METAQRKPPGTPVVTGTTAATAADEMVPGYIPGKGFTPAGIASLKLGFKNRVIPGEPITEQTPGVIYQRALDRLAALGLRPSNRPRKSHSG